jgi:hypothetical protein
MAKGFAAKSLLVAEFARILVLANAIRKSGDFRYVIEDTL